MSNKETHKDIEALAVLFGGGISLLIITDVILITAVCLLL